MVVVLVRVEAVFLQLKGVDKVVSGFMQAYYKIQIMNKSVKVKHKYAEGGID